MARIKLKCGGKTRKKALLGADGAAMAAATIAAAGINATATANAAKTQADAAIQNAKTQAQSIKDQTLNNNNLQKEQIAFTREQNQENRQQQQNIQTTLQLMAGQENMNDRMERQKIQVKYGGKPKRGNINAPFYGGAQFQVTDGGGVIPLSVSPEGYGLYELYGNDHEHYHKAPGGKNKTGVGIKFNNGAVVEGEGNQNTNQGELLYVTPYDAMFISKHSIDGFNPTKAVLNGANPEEVFAMQEALKDNKGLNSDGTKKKHRSMKRMMGGPTIYHEQANITQNPNNGTAPVAGGVIYALNNTTSPVELKNNDAAKCGGRIRLKCGGRKKALLGYNPLHNIIPGGGVTGSLGLGGVYNTQPMGNSGSTVLNTNNNGRLTGSKGNSFWDDYAGATYNAIGNLLGAGFTTLGNIYAGKNLGQAYMQAGNILADAYDQMHGIDLSEIKREDYAAPHTLAVVRTADTNINPQLERIRRNSAAETREINRGTMSSAARQQRLAGTNDRMFQRMGEQYAWKHNQDEQIKQGNVQSINQTAQANADRDVQANKDYTGAMLQGMMYNNNIENSKIAGKAQARADALTQSQFAKSSAFQNSMGAIGGALSASGQGFASAYDAIRKFKAESAYNLIGMNDVQQIDWVVANKDLDGARRLLSLKTAQLNRPGLTSTDRAKIQSDIDYINSKFPNLK